MSDKFDEMNKWLKKASAVFSIDMYRKKVERVYQHVYDSYFGEGRTAGSCVPISH